MSIKLVSLNIELNKHYDRILPFLKYANPDVVCLQEVLEEDYEYLQKEIGYEGIFKRCGFQRATYEHYKETYGKPYGIAIFAKTILDIGYQFYWGKEENLELTFKEFNDNYENLRSYVFVWVTTKDSLGERYTLATTHFAVTHEGESSPHQLETLVPFFEKLDTLKDHFLCGDFNAPRGNETFSHLSKKYNDCIPQRYTASIDKNLHRKGKFLAETDDLYMVDGLFLRDPYQAENVSLVDGVSDHMAIVATISKN